MAYAYTVTGSQLLARASTAIAPGRGSTTVQIVGLSEKIHLRWAPQVKYRPDHFSIEHAIEGGKPDSPGQGICPDVPQTALYMHCSENHSVTL